MEHSTTELRGLSPHEQLLQHLLHHQSLLQSSTALLGGLFIAMGRINGETAPFGVAFAAAAPQAVVIPAAMGAVLGYLLAAPTPSAWQYTLASAAAALLAQMLQHFIPKGRWQPAAAALAAVTAAVILPGLYGDPLVYDVLLWITTLMMAGAGSIFLQRSLAALTEKTPLHKDPTLTAPLWLSAALCLMGLCSVTFADVSLGRVAALVLVLLTAAGAGCRLSALTGVIAGMVIGFADGEVTLWVTVFAVGGLLSGIFAPLGRLGSVLALTICCGFFAMLASRSAAGFIEVMLASIAFLMLPAACSRRMGQLFSPRREQQVTRLVMAEKLGDASAALRDVADTTRRIAEHLRTKTAEDESAVYDRVAERYCKGCLYQMTCWQTRYNDTAAGFAKAAAHCRRTGSIPPEALQGVSERCPFRPKIAAALEREYKAYAAREEERRHAGRVRGIVTDQFEGLAGALEGLSAGAEGILPCSESLARRITESIGERQREVQEVLCWRSSAGRLTVRVQLPASMEHWLDAAELGEAITSAAGIPMGDAQTSREGARLFLTFSERPRYRLQHGFCQLPAGEKGVSGDTLRLVRCGEGRAALVLSDGMGSGAAAALDSAMLSSLVCRLLEAGIRCGSALRLVNSALMVKGGRESLATLDAAEVDCHTGRVSFYKAGAAPTFLRMGGRIVTVEAMSLPAGILNGIEPALQELTLAEGDVILMVSDGVPTEEDWITPLLADWREGSLSDLCRRVAESARLRCRDAHPDDITVAALQLTGSGI